MAQALAWQCITPSPPTKPTLFIVVNLSRRDIPSMGIDITSVEAAVHKLIDPATADLAAVLCYFLWSQFSQRGFLIHLTCRDGV